jgi:hypothetical protein
LLAERHVSLDLLPVELRAHAAGAWTLIAPDGRCTAHLGTPVLVRRLDGWMGTIAELDEGEAEPVPFADPRSFAARAWPSASEVLAAPLEGPEGQCRDLRVAFPSTTHVARVFSPADVDDALAVEAVAAFEALPRYAAVQADYDELRRIETGLPARWVEYDGMGESSTGVQRLRSEDGHELVLVFAHGELGCGGFGGSLYAVLERTNGALVAVDQGEWDGLPELIVDGEDGTRTYVASERLRRPTDLDEYGSARWIDARSPWIGCNC